MRAKEKKALLDLSLVYGWSLPLSPPPPRRFLILLHSRFKVSKVDDTKEELNLSADNYAVNSLVRNPPNVFDLLNLIY